MSTEDLSLTACPHDELLAGLIEGRVDGTERAALERHVAACRDCADVVAAALASGDAPARSRLPHLGAAGRHLALAAGLLLVASALLGYGSTALVVGRVAAVLADRAGARIGRPVTIGGLALRAGRDLRTLVLHLDDVRVGGEGPDAGSIPTIDVALALPPLWRGAFEVVGVRLLRPLLQVAPPGPGPAPAGLGGTPGARAVRAGLEALAASVLEIVDGALVMRMANGPALTLRAVHGRSTPVAEGTRVAATAALDGGTLAITGTVPSADGGALAVTIDGRDLPLAALPYARGRVTGTADLHITVTGSVASPRIAGRVRVREGRVTGWSPLPSLLGEARSAAALVPELAAGDLRFSELRAAFAIHRGALRLPRLLIAGEDVAVAATLRATAASELRGAGVVRFAAPVADALVTALPGLASRRDGDGSVSLPFSLAGTADAPRYVARF